MPGLTQWRRHRRLRRLLGERGAAAVEFALVVPVLLVLVMGIVEYSRAFNAQAVLSAAAREGARAVAVGEDLNSARTAVQTAAGSLRLTNQAIAITPTTCTGAAARTTVTVTVTYRQTFASGLLGRTGVTLTGRAAMRCEP